MKYRRAILMTIGVAAILVSFTSQASADILPGTPAFELLINDNSQGHPISLQPPGIFNDDTKKFKFDSRGNAHTVPGRFSLEWSIEVDPDPYVNAILSLTNLTNSDMDFSVTADLDIFPAIFGGSLTGGSVSFTLIDMNGDGATLGSIADDTPIYMSRIDGEDFKALMAAPVTYNVPANNTRGFGPDQFGPTPTDPTFPGPEVLDTIEIVLNANISANDTALIVATFVVVQDPSIPEPATMSLLALGGATMLARRRRRQA